MLNIYEEGITPKPGLSVYSLKDKASAGIILRIKDIVYRMRYSKNLKKFLFRRTKLTKAPWLI